MDDGLLGDCGLGLGCVQLRQFLNIVLQQDSSYSSFFIKLAGTLTRFPSGTLLPLLFWGFFVKTE